MVVSRGYIARAGDPPVARRASEADAFWGPSVHWNTYLERYVMFLNRAENERFDNEGLYVSYATRLDDPRAWSTPRKVMDGGEWYPQVVGLEPGRAPTSSRDSARASW